MNYIICVLLRFFFWKKNLLERFIFFVFGVKFESHMVRDTYKGLCSWSEFVYVFFTSSSSKLVNTYVMYIYSFLIVGIVVQSIVIVGTLFFFCPLIFTKSEVCDYRSGAQRGYFGFLLMDLCEFSGFEFILGSFLSFISLVEKGWICFHQFYA